MPIRLLVFNKVWKVGALRYVDRWACRPGGPEDEDDDVVGTNSGNGNVHRDYDDSNAKEAKEGGGERNANEKSESSGREESGQEGSFGARRCRNIVVDEEKGAG